LYETQLRHYLQKFDIASADIPHIKDGRKAMLSAYGIDDASDVARSALENVPGFGHFLIIQLITWRQSLEATFKFNPGRGIDPADINVWTATLPSGESRLKPFCPKAHPN
jgi:DNA-binding helix-hairpin-helix protein with protein kinase domain